MSLTVDVAGVRIDLCTRSALLQSWSSARFIVPVNVDVIMKLRRDAEFRCMIREVGEQVRFICDSQVIRIAVRLILGVRIPSRISGSDLLPDLCRLGASNDSPRVFLLGGMDDAAARAREALNSLAAREVVVGAASPSMGFDRKPDEAAKLVEAVRQSGADLLAVGVGAPKQEKWMLRYADAIPGVKVFLAVGASIDFQAGKVRRAPQFLSDVGLEWLFRLVQEPRRLARRYLIEGPPFFWLLLLQRIGWLRD